MECCENSDIQIINGIYTCVKCGIVHGPQLVNSWIDYNPRNVVSRKKTVYSRTEHIKQKLKKLQLSFNETDAFFEVWNILEPKLKAIFPKRFPKIDFFICNILEALDIKKTPSYQLSSALREKYEIIWWNIILKADLKLEDIHQQLGRQP